MLLLSISKDLYAHDMARNFDALQPDAALERLLTHDDDALGDGDGRETGTVFKSTAITRRRPGTVGRADFTKAIRQDDFLQIAAVEKSIGAYDRDPGRNDYLG